MPLGALIMNVEPLLYAPSILGTLPFHLTIMLPSSLIASSVADEPVPSIFTGEDIVLSSSPSLKTAFSLVR